MVNPRRSKHLITAARRAAGRADSLDDALQRLAAILREDFPGIVRVSLRALLTDGTVRVAGLWSEGPSRVGKGFIVRLLATSLPELRRGEAVAQRLNSRNPPLDDVLKEEGVWSWISMPVRDSGEIVAVLSFSSSDINEFGGGAEAFFTKLGRTIEGKLLVLTQRER